MSILGMKDPVLYNRYNRLQHRDNRRCLEENLQRVVWRGSDRVLDVGSGDGGFTASVLRPALPGDIELVGCDKSEEMIAYANQHHRAERVTFQLLEIGNTLPAEYRGSFDHIFSFFALHWISDQRLAISQVYNILSEGGDCLLLIVANFPVVFEVYRCLGRSKRWSHWVKDLDDLISYYHDSVDPERELTNIAHDVGFKKVFVKCEKSSYTYASIEDFKNMIRSLNPFAIPEDLMEEYLEEYVKVAQDAGYLSDDLTINYTTNTMYGRK